MWRLGMIGYVFASLIAGGAHAAAVVDPSVGVQKWNEWLSSRPKPCAEQVDSHSAFAEHGVGSGENKVALVLHGFSSNPSDMNQLSAILSLHGYTVLAPRLSGHFDADIHDLADAKYTQWQNDAEQTFKIAQHFAPKVTLVGYSLGGLLASNLALNHPNSIDRMILIAPAWRVSSTTSLSTLAGQIFGLSLNDYLHTPAACQSGRGYTPPTAGAQVEALGEAIEEKHGNRYTETFPTAFNMKLPHLVFTTPLDQAVDSAQVSEICSVNSYFCWHAEMLNQTHATIVHALASKVSGGRYENLTMRQAIGKYLDLNAGN